MEYFGKCTILSVEKKVGGLLGPAVLETSWLDILE